VPSSSLTIQELRSTGRGRTLTLIGAGLPFMGAEWGFENNLITTWYPGTGAEGSQQVLGPRELPSNWQGEWKRTMLSRSPCVYTDENGTTVNIVQPSRLRDIIESIGRAAYRLRVTWEVTETEAAGGGGKIVREGRIKQARFPHDRWTDIRWNVEFHWMSRGGAKQTPVDTRDDSKFASLVGVTTETAKAAIATWARLNRALNGVDGSATSFTLGQLESLADYPLQLANQLKQTVERATTTFQQIAGLAAKVTSLPKALANSAVNEAQNVEAVVRQWRDTFSRRGTETLSRKATVSDVLRASTYFTAVAESTFGLGRQAHALEVKFRDVLQPAGNQATPTRRATGSTDIGRLIAIHRVKAGETPQMISARYYGDPDHVIDIMRANRLPWHQTAITPGTLLVIPVLTASSPTSF
jgi:hypothetical protein